MDHYYSENPVSPLNLRRIPVFLRGMRFELYSGSGVFSINHVDKGTEVLIENCTAKEGDDILDLGCGYGAVGITLAKIFPDAKITMSDINQRAVKLSKMNVDLHRLENVKVVQSNSFEGIKQEFDIIIFNPPQNAGKELCFSMLEESKNHLRKNGKLEIVVRKNKGGESFQKKMLEIFGNVEVIAKKSGFWVYSSAKK